MCGNKRLKITIMKMRLTAACTRSSATQRFSMNSKYPIRTPMDAMQICVSIAIESDARSRVNPRRGSTNCS
jgi:hypothetical protein